MKPSRLVPLAVLVLALVVSIGLVPLFRDGGPGRGEAIVSVDGRARLTRLGGVSENLTGRTKLHRGDLIELEKGRADFRLADGVRYEGRAGGAAGRAGTTVRMAYVPTLLAGRLLVTADRSATVTSAGTRIVLYGEGRPAAMRLANTVALSVGVYAGDASIDSAGATLDVPALRATEIAAAGDVSRRADPLSYVATDRWDRRYLEAAVALDEAVQPLLTGFRASGGSALGSVERLRASMRHPASAAELGRLIRTRHDGGGSLVGAAIVGMSSDHTFLERWRRVFAFRDVGASWGIVAMDRQVDGGAVVDSLSRALNSSEFAFGNGGRGSGQTAAGEVARPAGNGTEAPKDGSTVTDPASGASVTTVPAGGTSNGSTAGSTTPAGSADSSGGAAPTQGGGSSPTTAAPARGAPPITAAPGADTSPPVTSQSVPPVGAGGGGTAGPIVTGPVGVIGGVLPPTGIIGSTLIPPPTGDPSTLGTAVPADGAGE